LADGWGPSLTFCNPSLDNSIPDYWTHSTEFVGLNAELDSIFATPAGGCLIPIPPVADFVANPIQVELDSAVQFTDLSSGGIITSWSWTFEGGTPASSTEQNPKVFYNSLGTFDVTLVVTNVDGTDTKTKVDYIVVEDNIGISTPSVSNFHIWPNPTTGLVNFDVPIGTQEIAVYSLVGNKVYSATISTTKSNLNLKELQKGVYFVKFIGGGQPMATRKLVIR
jgi:PKD repeat protein